MYFGWSDKFDETISAYSPRIQKLDTIARVRDVKGNLIPRPDDNPDLDD